MNQSQDPEKKPKRIPINTTPGTFRTPNIDQIIAVQQKDDRHSILNTPNCRARKPGIIRPSIDAPFKIASFGKD